MNTPKRFFMTISTPAACFEARVGQPGEQPDYILTMINRAYATLWNFPEESRLDQPVSGIPEMKAALPVRWEDLFSGVLERQQPESRLVCASLSGQWLRLDFLPLDPTRLACTCHELANTAVGRVKEMNFLKEIGFLLRSETPLSPRRYLLIAESVRQIVQDPEQSAVVITVDQECYRAGEHAGAGGENLRSSAKADRVGKVVVEVFKREGKPFLLPFEQDVVDQVADLLNLSIDRHQLQRQIIEERELFKDTLFSLVEAVIAIDRSMRVRLVNPGVGELTGYPDDEILGRPLFEVFPFVHADTGKDLRKLIRDVLRTGKARILPDTALLETKSGDRLRIRGHVSPILSDQETVTGAVVAVREISDEHLREERVEGFLNADLNMLCVSDAEGNFVKVNIKFKEVLGYQAEELEGRNCHMFIHPEDLATTEEALTEMRKNRSIGGFVNRFRSSDGSYKYLEWKGQIGEGDRLYLSARDMTSERLNEEKLRMLTIRDELTGLYNRRYFENIIPQMMERADRYSESLSFLLLDIDHFKAVNDRYGHQAGDEVLRKMGRILRKTMRGSDVIFRFGGDEFLVVMPQTGQADAVRAGEKLRREIAGAGSQTMKQLTVSAGVAERMKAESLRHWFRRTDEALYRAKRRGRNRVVAYDSDIAGALSTLAIAWETDWQSGHDGLDEQHRDLFAAGNNLSRAISENADQAIIRQYLDQLQNHLTEHFEYEETLLEQAKYSEREKHIEIHRSVISKLKQLTLQYENHEIKPIAFLSFVIDDVLIKLLLEEDPLTFPSIRACIAG